MIDILPFIIFVLYWFMVTLWQLKWLSQWYFFLFYSFKTCGLFLYELIFTQSYITFIDSFQWYDCFNISLYWINIQYWMCYGRTELPTIDYWFTRLNDLPINIFIFLKGLCWRWKDNHVISIGVFISSINVTNWTNFDSFICVIYKTTENIFLNWLIFLFICTFVNAIHYYPIIMFLQYWIIFQCCHWKNLCWYFGTRDRSHDKSMALPKLIQSQGILIIAHLPRPIRGHVLCYSEL